MLNQRIPIKDTDDEYRQTICFSAPLLIYSSGCTWTTPMKSLFVQPLTRLCWLTGKDEVKTKKPGSLVLKSKKLIDFHFMLCGEEILSIQEQPWRVFAAGTPRSWETPRYSRRHIHRSMKALGQSIDAACLGSWLWWRRMLSRGDSNYIAAAGYRPRVVKKLAMEVSLHSLSRSGYGLCDLAGESSQSMSSFSLFRLRPLLRCLDSKGWDHLWTNELVVVFQSL